MAQTAAGPVGTLATALGHATRLLARDASMAEAQAREILKVLPRSAEALRVLALALAGQARGREALAAMHRAVALEPRTAAGWGALADALSLAEDAKAADQARARQIRASVSDPELVQAATALCEERLAVAERLLKAVLKARPTEVAAIRMLAEVAGRLGRYEDAETLLTRALELAPGFAAARRNLAVALYRQNRPADALAELDLLLEATPEDAGLRSLRAAALARAGDYDGAIGAYEAVLTRHPAQAKGWMSYGHALKTVGRQADAVAAYRRSLEQAPGLGEAWWSLANLKTVRFEPADLDVMRGQLARSELVEEDRFHLHFALGKALEDGGDPAGSFAHYAQGAALRRAGLDYDPDETRDHVRRSKALFTPAFFAERAGQGCEARDPIFIVGLPRAGSTLIEQILASHSQVEGTMELPDIPALARRIGGKRRRSEASAYPEALAALTAGELRSLGEEYLGRTQVQRRLGRPLFIDKMPNNFAHLGLIHLILPGATIIDARRHPLGCCFSAFKQHFARGQAFSYSLDEIGRYYADYVELMAHFDAVLPGRVCRVFYEEMVAEPETQIRRLLDHCGLEFEPQCLAFHETERAVRTASSEQVRRPIFTDAVDHWRSFEPWLGPLKAALGPVLGSYPAAPRFG